MNRPSTYAERDCGASLLEDVVIAFRIPEDTYVTVDKHGLVWLNVMILIPEADSEVPNPTPDSPHFFNWARPNFEQPTDLTLPLSPQPLTSGYMRP